MNRFWNISNKIIIAAIITLSLTLGANAQFGSGAWGLNAGIALPAGVTQSAGVPNSSFSNVSYTYTASAYLVYVMSQSLALQFGVGFLNSSFTVPEGQTASDAVSVLSLSVAGKHYLGGKGDVMPYLGLGFSFTNLPKTGSETTEITGSLITVFGCFGAEGFLNASKTVSVFIQMGLGYNMFSTTTKVGTQSYDNGQNTLNLGGSAVGANVYF